MRSHTTQVHPVREISMRFRQGAPAMMGTEIRIYMATVCESDPVWCGDASHIDSRSVGNAPSRICILLLRISNMQMHSLYSARCRRLHVCESSRILLCRRRRWRPFIPLLIAATCYLLHFAFVLHAFAIVDSFRRFNCGNWKVSSWRLLKSSKYWIVFRSN